MQTGELTDAKADLMAAYNIDNENKDVRRAIKELKAKIVEEKKKEKTQFGGLFGRVILYDEKKVNLLLVPTAKGDELINFPDTILAAVAEYLTKTERALAASAMTASSTSWSGSNFQIHPCEASKVMVTAKPLKDIKISYCSPDWRKQSDRKKSYQWDFVDFEDVDKVLAVKLTDGDIGGLLVCINAVNTIKKLKLKGCVNITGRALEPLRGSKVLEQIDLSLVGAEGTWNESPDLPFVPDISSEVVIPILDSIIDVEGSALEHIQLPKKWRVEQSDLLRHFLARYNRALNSRELTCSHKQRYKDPPCGETCHDFEDTPLVPHDVEHQDFGIQHFTCYECQKHFCEEHSEWMVPGVCEICEKVACNDCHKTTSCDECYKFVCWKCTRIEYCDSCDRDLCYECGHVFWCDGCEGHRCEECSPFLFCGSKGCNQGNCTECAEVDGDFDWAVKKCSECDATFCVDHLIVEMSIPGEHMFCAECNDRAAAETLRTNKKILEKIHVWEKLLGYEETFESDLERESCLGLLEEQKNMKRRWDDLSSKLTAEQRKKTVCIDNMFSSAI